MDKKPNIVYVFADQLRYQSCGYAGDAKARTPHVDRMADEGSDFSNAVVSMPVCSAYRASLWTGKYTTSTGMVINELRMNPNHECLAHRLTAGGYDTGHIGKWHLWANELGNHHDPANAWIPPGPHRLGFDGYWAGYNFHHEYYDTYYHMDSPERIYHDSGVYEPDAQTDLAIDFIGRQAGKDKPFALFLSIGTPHDPWDKENVPASYYDLFRDTSFPTPINYQEEPDVPYGDAWSDIPKNPDLIDEWMRVYYAMVANIDWNVSRLQAAITDAGIEDETIFVFTSDHGEMFGAHGRMKKNIFYEEAARVPFLMKWPGHVSAGQRTDVCLSCVDIMPTLLGLVGIPVPSGVEGMDLSHWALGEPGPEPDAAFMQNTGACAAWENGHEWRGLRDKKYTYAVYRVNGVELLFDHTNDPYQMRNLTEDPAHCDPLNRFRKMIAAKMTSINDTFEESVWYKEHWISEDRRILRTATLEG
ncbi:MAG: sulfatase [Candidatus Latescibacteria bacterium]|nr:sulfatase [Candidatus Latescibacterota bacterium]